MAVSHPDDVLGTAVTALLGPQTAEPDEVRAAAQEGVRLVRERRQVIIELIATQAEQPSTDRPG